MWAWGSRENESVSQTLIRMPFHWPDTCQNQMTPAGATEKTFEEDICRLPFKDKSVSPGASLPRGEGHYGKPTSNELFARPCCRLTLQSTLCASTSPTLPNLAGCLFQFESKWKRRSPSPAGQGGHNQLLRCLTGSHSDTKSLPTREGSQPGQLQNRLPLWFKWNWFILLLLLWNCSHLRIAISRGWVMYPGLGCPSTTAQ